MGNQHGTFPPSIEQIEFVEHFPSFKHSLNTTQKIEHIEHFPFLNIF